MLPLLGLCCVAWTVFELTRLIRSARTAPAPSARPPETDTRPRSDSAASSRPRRRFAAWDDLGRPIPVEDLGHP